MKIRHLNSLLLSTIFAAWIIAAPLTAAPDAAPAKVGLDEFLAILDQLKSDPTQLRAAAAALSDRLNKARAESEKLKADEAAAEKTRTEAAAQAAALRSDLDGLAKTIEEARAQLAAIDQGLAANTTAVESARKASGESAQRVQFFERALELLSLSGGGLVAPSAVPAPTTASAPAIAEKPVAAPPPAPSEKPAIPAPAAAPAAAPAPPAVKPVDIVPPAVAAAPPITPEAADFFETKIRPVLAQSCYGCHGPDKQKSGLRLDSLAAGLKGGETGPAIVPGDLEKSLLIKAIRYEGEFQMPPKGKLPDEAIAALTEWIKMGAPWPGSEKQSADAGATDAKPAKASPELHWAFQPVKNPVPPSVSSSDWVKTPIDAFILARLDEKGLKPNAPADRRSLIRRATVDLTGLQPTLEEIRAFEADTDPAAYEKLVDRLLDSPRYGERWARYWLDIARYADTKGYVFQEERRYAFSYTYRDYVINAFNHDLPYDRFLIEQLAADQLDLGDDKKPLAAMGFLTLGRRFLNNKNDVIDDRIDTLGRGLMGLTIACARCHDHKFDPIPTKDYYSLHGVFSSSQEPAELPLIGETENKELFAQYQVELDRLGGEVENFLTAKHMDFLAGYRRHAADYLLAAQEGRAAATEDDFQKLARDRQLSHHIVRRWQAWLDESAKSFNPVMAAWNAFAALKPEDFAAGAQTLAAGIAANADAEHKHNPLVAKAFEGDAPATLADVAQRYGKLFEQADGAWAELLKSYSQIVAVDGQKEIKGPVALPDPSLEAIRVAVLYGATAPSNAPRALLETLMDLPTRDQLRNRRLAVDAHKVSHPGRPPRAQVMNDAPEPKNSKVLIRGQAGNPGDEVPRHFLTLLAGPEPKPFEKGSGRLELAQAIADRSNPLTARVFVNRVWMYHFGAPLVGTPSDFGMRSEPPTHPELLDWLASNFMENGWSVKKLHRTMMLSSAYRQSSADSAAGEAADPENHLLWRANRRRLDFEAMRDSVLQAAGALDLTMGGPPVEITEGEGAPRRSIYGFVERQNLPGLFRTFDFASPDSSSARRFQTTIPQQALYLMNSPFAIAQARRLAARDEVKTTTDSLGRAGRMIELAYGRPASQPEEELAVKFVEQGERNPGLIPERMWSYGYGEYNAEAKTIASFTPLPYFGKGRWSGGEKLPDPAIGWVSLHSRSGHPGHDRAHCAIRRWTAPRDGTVAIEGKLTHAADAGDGVSGYIVSSRAGQVGAWDVKHGEAETNVEKIEVAANDTIDFVVDPRTTEESDGFGWAPRIKMIEEHAAANQVADGMKNWDAEQDFSGPPPEPLDAWGQYAQVLLASNEFAFVD